MGEALVVISDEKIFEKVRAVLSALKFSSKRTGTIAEAMVIIPDGGYDIIVVDRALPDGDGIVFVREVRAELGEKYIPLFILVPKFSDDIVRIAVDSGADDVLSYNEIRSKFKNMINARLRVKSSYDLLAQEIDKSHQEMEMARKVQEKLLPATLPNNDKVRFAARYLPAQGVGGDFYDIIVHEDDTIGLFISDVTGHGIHAAFTTMSIKTALNTWARGIVSPSETFILINNLVLSIVDMGRFVSAFYGKLDLDNMEFIYSNAGHPPALLFRKGVREPEVLDTDTGFAFGITPECVYQEKTVKLQSYDKIFLYTDGIVEARNPDSRIYGVESFNKTVADNFDKPIEQILDALMKDVAKFADGAVFLDDINILAMEVL